MEQQDDSWNMDEFFVLRKHRRHGVGTAVAREMFRRFPGRWRVAQTPRNTGAQAFWRKVIGEYTGGRYTEATPADPGWEGRPVQEFEVPGGRGDGFPAGHGRPVE